MMVRSPTIRFYFHRLNSDLIPARARLSLTRASGLMDDVQ
jgi:hypothetical protein